jgi:histidine triad (HIT) family protein
VIPKKHFVNIYDIPPDELADLIKIVQKIALSYRQSLGIKNVQVLHSAGKYAQQEVPHFHFHLIPRKEKDGLSLSLPARPELREKFDQLLKKIKEEL